MASRPVLAPRAHDLLVSAVGRYVHPDQRWVYSGTLLQVLQAVGVKENAARSALSRAATRGQLDKQRVGRRSYYRLTPHTHEQLTKGEQRIYREPPVLRDWDETWTMVTFSLPESRRPDRYRLRVRLGWAGFGPLRDGLWIAPGRVDPSSFVDDLGVEGDLLAFSGGSLAITDERRLLEQVWDLATMECGLRGFLERWPMSVAEAQQDPLVTELHLITDWRLLLRTAPRLPATLLPDGWPAEEAAERFLKLHHALAGPADERYLTMVERPPAVRPHGPAHAPES